MNSRVGATDCQSCGTAKACVGDLRSSTVEGRLRSYFDPAVEFESANVHMMIWAFAVTDLLELWAHGMDLDASISRANPQFL
jgi:hypothetical protein